MNKPELKKLLEEKLVEQEYTSWRTGYSAFEIVRDYLVEKCAINAKHLTLDTKAAETEVKYKGHYVCRVTIAKKRRERHSWGFDWFIKAVDVLIYNYKSCNSQEDDPTLEEVIDAIDNVVIAETEQKNLVEHEAIKALATVPEDVLDQVVNYIKEQYRYNLSELIKKFKENN